jgi:type II secretory pathway component PulK
MTRWSLGWRRPDREGFALLAVLWVMVGVVALSSAATLVARQTLAGVRNRIALTEASWQAEGCAAAVLAAVHEVVARREEDQSGWSMLGRLVARDPTVRTAPCDVSLRAAGSALDLNSASPLQLRRLFRLLGFGRALSDSLADALVDWRDADDTPHPSGAEQAWYAAELRSLPRNGKLASYRELRSVRGFENMPRLDSLLGVEPERIPLDHAPLLVLATLPGFTEETVHLVAARRARGQPVGTLLELGGLLSHASRDSLAVHHGELSNRVASEPEAWILISRASVGQPPVDAVVELKVHRAARRVAVVRRRTW